MKWWPETAWSDQIYEKLIREPKAPLSKTYRNLRRGSERFSSWKVILLQFSGRQDVKAGKRSPQNYFIPAVARQPDNIGLGEFDFIPPPFPLSGRAKAPSGRLWNLGKIFLIFLENSNFKSSLLPNPLISPIRGKIIVFPLPLLKTYSMIFLNSYYDVRCSGGIG